MKLLQSIINGQGKSLLARTVVGRRNFCSAAVAATTGETETAHSAEYRRRNYAANVSEYNTVMDSLTNQRRHYLLKDAYDDMKLDGIQPTRDIFHSLIVGTMKGGRLNEAFHFRDEMKAMGLVPDLALYNFLISACGKCRHSELADQLFEEMKINDVKPSAQTYVCLLNACAASGRLDRVHAIVRDMTAAGLGLNRFCYAGLISAHRNKVPLADDLAAKVLDLVQQSKGWTTPEGSSNMAENAMMGVSLEELYNIPTAEYLRTRRGNFLDKRLTVYHVAAEALACLPDVEAMELLLGMLRNDAISPDPFITLQEMRCYLRSGDIDRGHKIFEEFLNSPRPPYIEYFVTFVEGAMAGYTTKGMELAYGTLFDMNSKNVFLNPKMGSDLLLIAAGERDGEYKTANYLWDMMESRNIVPNLPAVEAYFNGLKHYEVPADDPRLMRVAQVLDSFNSRFNRSQVPVDA